MATITLNFNLGKSLGAAGQEVNHSGGSTGHATLTYDDTQLTTLAQAKAVLRAMESTLLGRGFK